MYGGFVTHYRVNTSVLITCLCTRSTPYYLSFIQLRIRIAKKNIKNAFR